MCIYLYQIGQGGFVPVGFFEKFGGHDISIGKVRLCWEMYMLK